MAESKSTSIVCIACKNLVLTRAFGKLFQRLQTTPIEDMILKSSKMQTESKSFHDDTILFIAVSEIYLVSDLCANSRPRSCNWCIVRRADVCKLM